MPKDNLLFENCNSGSVLDFYYYSKMKTKPGDVITFEPHRKSSLPIHRLFLDEIMNGQPTEYSKCIKCSKIIKRPNSGTKSLYTHRDSCQPEFSVSGQSMLPFAPRKTSNSKAVELAARLVYEDNISLNQIVNSQVIKEVLTPYGNYSRHSVNKCIGDSYQLVLRQIRAFIDGRDERDILCVSFDKWTSPDSNKFLGLYLYCRGESICLDLFHFKGTCGAEEVAAMLKKHLAIFGLGHTDIHVQITDCGSDMQKVGDIFNWFTFPCLAHIVNLIVKRFICSDSVNSDSGCDVPEPRTDIESDEDEDTSTECTQSYFNNAIQVARQIVRDVHRKPLVRDRLEELQVLAQKVPKKVLIDCRTRWNSLYDMGVRFLDLRESLMFLYPDKLRNYDWDRLKEITNALYYF